VQQHEKPAKGQETGRDVAEGAWGEIAERRGGPDDAGEPCRRRSEDGKAASRAAPKPGRAERPPLQCRSRPACTPTRAGSGTERSPPRTRGAIGGVLFLLLYADGRLSAPFAPVAGIGDIIVGALALLFATMLALRYDMRRSLLSLWNAFGVLDLVVAVALGLLSAPGIPFRIFFEEPGTQAMAILPWLFAPAMLVPIYFLIHVAIAAKLKSAAAASHLAIA
jgi:hypothetical protein